MVRRAAAVEPTVDVIDFPQTPVRDEPDPGREKIEALADIICGGGNEAVAALLVLMGALQNSADPRTLAQTAKHCAFTRCGELNVFGMV